MVVKSAREEELEALRSENTRANRSVLQRETFKCKHLYKSRYKQKKAVVYVNGSMEGCLR